MNDGKKNDEFAGNWRLSRKFEEKAVNPSREKKIYGGSLFVLIRQNTSSDWWYKIIIAYICSSAYIFIGVSLGFKTTGTDSECEK